MIYNSEYKLGGVLGEGVIKIIEDEFGLLNDGKSDDGNIDKICKGI